MFRHDSTDTKPCVHMRVWVSALADDALTGVVRWYTKRHVASCPQCQKGLTTIHSMRQRLQTIHESGEVATLPSERWASVESAWKRSDATHSRPTP